MEEGAQAGDEAGAETEHWWLTDELLLHVLSFLRPVDLHCCRAVNHQWRRGMLIAKEVGTDISVHTSPNNTRHGIAIVCRHFTHPVMP